MDGPASTPGRLAVCAFDPGCDTGWSWLCVAQDSARFKGTGETLREVRPDVELHTLDPEAAGLLLGTEHGQFGRREGLSEDQQVDKMMTSIRACWVHYDLDPSRDVLAVVAERFTLRQMDMDDDLLAPVRLNAKLERDLRHTGMRLWLQTPSDAMRTVTDARLKHWNVYDPSSGKHARDADRHSILFARRWGSQAGLRKAVELGQPNRIRVGQSTLAR